MRKEYEQDDMDYIIGELHFIKMLITYLFFTFIVCLWKLLDILISMSNEI